MIEKIFQYGDKCVRITACAENAVRIRVGDERGESLFDRYGLYRKPDEVF